MVMLELKVRRYAAQLLDVRASLSLPLLLRGLRAPRPLWQLAALLHALLSHLCEVEVEDAKLDVPPVPNRPTLQPARGPRSTASWSPEERGTARVSTGASLLHHVSH